MLDRLDEIGGRVGITSSVVVASLQSQHRGVSLTCPQQLLELGAGGLVVLDDLHVVVQRQMGYASSREDNLLGLEQEDKGR